MRATEFNKDDYKIHDRKYLNKILVELCEMIVEGQKNDPDQHGMVAACVLDPDHNKSSSTSTKEGDKWRHAERNAIEEYEQEYGEIPKGSIIITTLSPCDSAMADRYQDSCTDLINASPVKKVYCGYMDPSQGNEDFEFTVEATTDKHIQRLCKKFADTFLGDEDHPLRELRIIDPPKFVDIYHKEFYKSGPARPVVRHIPYKALDQMLKYLEKNYGLTPHGFEWRTSPETKNLSELDVSKTLNFIKKAHSAQQYGNKPYWNHPKSVAATGKKFFGAAFGPDAIKAAFLHDVVEDTPYTLEQLDKMGFSPEVVQAVQLLTKNKSLSYEDNIKNIIASGNKIAMMVKYADNYQNYTGDKSSWEPNRAAASQKKYLASLNMLGNKLGIRQHIN